MAYQNNLIISVITVVYNNCKTIEQAIQSVLNQNYEYVEYIIIDGNSTDGTKEILNRYIDRISVIISEDDSGIYDAMNKGIKLANGDVIGLLNSDDVFASNEILSTIANTFKCHNVDMVYGDLAYVKANNLNDIVRIWKSKPYYKEFFDFGNVPPHPTLYLKKEVYQNVGLYNTKFYLASDYEFMLRLFKKYNYTSNYINILMIKMRLGGATNKSILNICKGNFEIFKAWKYNSLSIPLFLLPSRFLSKIYQFYLARDKYYYSKKNYNNLIQL